MIFQVLRLIFLDEKVLDMEALNIRLLMLCLEVCVLCGAYADEPSDSLPDVTLGEIVVETSVITENAQGYKIRLAGQKLVEGKTAEQVFVYLPHVTVDDGTVKINGIAASEIYVDGRKVYNREDLKSLPAEFIEAVEVTFTATAGQITSTTGGAMRIILKKATPNGFYGNLQGKVSLLNKIGFLNESVGGSVSARIDKFSLFLFPYASWLNTQEWTEETASTTYGLTKETLRNKIGLSSFGNTISVGYDFSKNHNLNVSWDISNSRSRNNSEEFKVDDMLFQSEGNILYNVLAVRYYGKLNTRGDRLSLRGEWLHHKSTLGETFLDIDSQTRDNLKQSTDLYEIGANYALSLLKSHQLVFGGSYKQTEVHSVRNGTRIEHGAIGVTDVKARTGVAFASIQGHIGAIDYYAGLNWQINSAKVTEIEDKHQSAFNPVVQLSYAFGSVRKHSLRFIYRHVLDRIPYDALSDKILWSDPYNYSVGNPNLKSQSGNNTTLMLGLWENTLSLAFSYDNDKDIIFWQTFVDSQAHATYVKPINLPSSQTYALMIEFNKKLFNIWNLKVYSRLGLSTEKNQLGDRIYDTTRLRQYYSLSNSLTFSGNWGLSANFYVEPTFHNYDRIYHTVYQFECGVHKNLFANRFQISASITPFSKRRRLDRFVGEQKIVFKYNTPTLSGSLRAVWFFRGGKKDIDVSVGGASLSYEEDRDKY